MNNNKISQPRSRVAQKSKKMTALDYALMYAGLGIRVIWIPPRSKAPVVKDWPNVATTEPAVIERWATEHPGCNFGLVMGDGFIAIDVDDPSRYPELKALGFDLPPTRVHKTASGLHLIYRVPLDVTIRNAVKKFGIVDIRHANAQVVCPGSVHPSGAVYEIAEDLPIADLPDETLRMLTVSEPSPRASGDGSKIPEGRRDDTLTSIAGRMRRGGMTAAEILPSLQEVNRTRCEPPLPDADVERIAHGMERYKPESGIQAMLNDTRPKVMLPGEDRLMSDVGAELGEHLADKLYLHANVIAAVMDSKLESLSAQAFRTHVEKHVVLCKQRLTTAAGLIQVGKTMSEGDARGLMASEQFRSRLRPLNRVNTCGLPVLRSNGALALLPEGYDAETRTLTISEVNYDHDMPFEDAVAVIRDLFGEFSFADDGRSLAVAISALIGLFGKQLLPEEAVRPSFIYTKNAEGAGASTCASIAVVPVLGRMKREPMPDDEPEMRKTLITAVREGQQVVMFDNVKKQINSGVLDAFISAPRFGGRLLGSNETVDGPNVATVFITANEAGVSPDMRRRSLFVELHLEEERAETRKFKRPISDDVLVAMRARILAACWSVVRFWDSQGRPLPSDGRDYSSFPAWANVIGGIVESAGFGSPLQIADVAAVADQDGDDMRVLVAAMKPGQRFKFQELVALCRVQEVFVGLVGTSDFDMKTAQKAVMGKMLGRYDHRQVADRKFFIEGKGHQRRYYVEDAKHGDTVEHGVCFELAKTGKNSIRGETPCSTVLPCSPTARKWQGQRHKKPRVFSGR